MSPRTGDRSSLPGLSLPPEAGAETGPAYAPPTSLLATIAQSAIDQAIPDSILTGVTLPTELLDTAGMHGAANPTRLVAPTPGLYLAGGSVQWAITAAGSRNAFLYKNGATALPGAHSVRTQAAASIDQLLSVPVLLAAGDYVELAVSQDSGGAVNLLAGAVGWLVFIVA